jgi:hypothetical protein
VAFLVLLAASLLTFRLVRRSSLPDVVEARRGLPVSVALLLLAIAVMVAGRAVGGPVAVVVGMAAAGAMLGAAVAIRDAHRAREREVQGRLTPDS